MRTTFIEKLGPHKRGLEGIVEIIRYDTTPEYPIDLLWKQNLVVDIGKQSTVEILAGDTGGWTAPYVNCIAVGTDNTAPTPTDGAGGNTGITTPGWGVPGADAYYLSVIPTYPSNGQVTFEATVPPASILAGTILAEAGLLINFSNVGSYTYKLLSRIVHGDITLADTFGLIYRWTIIA